MPDAERSALTGLVLVDAGGGTDAASLTDGASVTLDDPANGSYGLVAAVVADAGVGSVRLELTGAKTVTATENRRRTRSTGMRTARWRAQACRRDPTR